MCTWDFLWLAYFRLALRTHESDKIIQSNSFSRLSIYFWTEWIKFWGVCDDLKNAFTVLEVIFPIIVRKWFLGQRVSHYALGRCNTKCGSLSHKLSWVIVGPITFKNKLVRGRFWWFYAASNAFICRHIWMFPASMPFPVGPNFNAEPEKKSLFLLDKL